VAQADNSAAQSTVAIERVRLTIMILSVFVREEVFLASAATPTVKEMVIATPFASAHPY
jgi:hypothetical protein